jgi:hypothetical protein
MARLSKECVFGALRFGALRRVVMARAPAILALIENSHIWPNDLPKVDTHQGN